MSDILQQQSVKSAEKLFSDALSITESLYRDKCEEVSGKYLAEAERLKKMTESSGQKWKELQDIEIINDKLDGLPHALTQNMKIDQMLKDYKSFREEVRQVGKSESTETRLQLSPRKPRTTLQKDMENRVSLWMVRFVQIGWRMELVLVLASAALIILSVF